MTFPRASFLPLLFVLGAACSAVAPNESADFANNDLFYVDVPFKTKAPGDRAIFVAPVADARDQTPMPAQERGFPITYGADDFWERPINDMLGDVLMRQLTSSMLFTRIEPQPNASDLVLKPSVVQFVAGATEAIFGSSSFAEIGLRLQVLGPADANGDRVVLHDKTYRNRQVSPVEVNPVHPFRLIGRSLQVTMNKALAGLDGSNVARSNVPGEAIGAPAEAASPAR